METETSGKFTLLAIPIKYGMSEQQLCGRQSRRRPSVSFDIQTYSGTLLCTISKARIIALGFGSYLVSGDAYIPTMSPNEFFVIVDYDARRRRGFIKMTPQALEEARLPPDPKKWTW